MIFITYKQLFLIFLGSSTTAFLITLAQRLPIYPVGIIDFIIGNQEEKSRIESILFIVGVPLLIGMILGLTDISSSIIIGITVGIGAFFSVSTAFIKKELLAPPLRANIKRARRIYLLFVLTYMLLGSLGGFIILDIPKLIQNNSFKSSLFINGINGLFYCIGGLTVKYIMTNASRKLNKEISKDKPYPKHESSKSPKISVNNLISKNIMNSLYIEVNKSIYKAIQIAIRKVNEESKIKFIEVFKKEVNKQIDQIDKMIELSFEQEKIRNLYDYEFKNHGFDEIAASGIVEKEIEKNYPNLYLCYRPIKGEDYYGTEYIKWKYPRHFS